MDKYSSSADGHEVEYCANCGNEIELCWDINRDGFQAFCPVCGNRLMLCDACYHRTGEYIDDCDYNPKADKCRFSRQADWWKTEYSYKEKHE